MVAFLWRCRTRWIFDGEYVVGLLFVHFVENGRERGGFSGAGRASNEHDAIRRSTISFSVTADGARQILESCRERPA